MKSKLSIPYYPSISSYLWIVNVHSANTRVRQVFHDCRRDKCLNSFRMNRRYVPVMLRSAQAGIAVVVAV